MRSIYIIEKKLISESTVGSDCFFSPSNEW